MPNFDKVLDCLRGRAIDMSGMGTSFDLLMKTALQNAPYKLGDRLIEVDLERVGYRRPAKLMPNTIK